MRFSTNQLNAYYECRPTYAFATLVYCEPNEFYSTEKEACRPLHDDNGSSKSSKRQKRAIVIKRSGNKPDDKPKILNYNVLDQDVRLGDFYDAKSSQYLAGTSLWSTDVLKKVKENNRNIISSYDYLYKTGRTTTERLDLMDIKASLKLDFLGKLIFLF